MAETVSLVVPCRNEEKYIIIMSAHGKYPRNYISNLLKWHKKLKCDNAGGLFKADVKI